MQAAFGIVITLLVAITALAYLLERGRWVQDEVESGKRIRLQELAIELGLQASTDPLTGLHNWLMLDKTLVDEMERSDRYRTPLPLVLFDVDHFKLVNDSYAHPVCDRVLVQLSRFVTSLLRKNDFLARWGGEEFLLLLSGVSGAMAFQAADKLRDALTTSRLLRRDQSPAVSACPSTRQANWRRNSMHGPTTRSCNALVASCGQSRSDAIAAGIPAARTSSG